MTDISEIRLNLCAIILRKMGISQQQYESAIARIEELLPLVSDDTPSDSPDAVELIKVSEIVREYELKHYPIGESEQA